MKIKNTPIDDLKPYKHNPKTHPEEQVDKIARSIEEFGFLVPVLIGSDNSIIAGHGRLMAARKLGLIEIPTICIDHLSEAQIRAYRIADNRLTESAWDLEMLESEIAILHDMDFDLDLTGFDDIEIGELFPVDPAPEDFDADAAMDDESVPLVQAGELWILGDHRLLCGDSTKSEDVERLMAGENADMVFTDPPYGMHLDADFSDMEGIGKGNKYDNVIGDHEDFSPILIEGIFKNFKGCKEVFLWGADYYSELLPNRNDGCWIVWDKMRGGDGVNDAYDKMFGSNFELCWSTKRHKRAIVRVLWKGIFGLSNEDTKKRIHPTQKPTELATWFIEKFSDVQNVLVDLFGGSGSTLIACEQINRRCYMMELDPHYCGVILDRWANYTNEDPIREDGMMWSELKESQQL